MGQVDLFRLLLVELGIELDEGDFLVNSLTFPQAGCIPCRILNKHKRMKNIFESLSGTGVLK